MTLDEALPELESGDLLLVRRSRTWFGRLVRLFSESPYSHAAMVVFLQAPRVAAMPAVLESLEGHGVRLYPLDRYVRECDAAGVILDWYRIVDERVDRDRLVGHALAHWGERYARPWQFVGSFGRLARAVRRWLRMPPDADTSGWFCSEIYADALLLAGYRPNEDEPPLVPAFTRPGDLAMLDCLQRRAVLTAKR